MAETWTVKTAESEEPKSAQETEAAVIEQAVESGEVSPEYGVEKDGVVRINLDKPPKEAVETPVKEVEEQEKTAETPVEEVAETPVQETTEQTNETSSPTLERVEESTESAATPPKQEEVLPEVEAQKLPEGVDKLVEFLTDTGGSVEDYVKLNRDVDTMEDLTAIKEYYREKYPHMNEERLSRKMDKNFLYDDLDDPDAIQDKKDLFEDEAFESKKYLKGRKDKYYAELKLSNQAELAPETREAVDFYQQNKAQAETNQKLAQTFQERTDQVFNEEFKGFNFKVGDTKYRYNVNDSKQIKTQQSDLNNFIKPFLGEDGSIKDAEGYHKAIWAAGNADDLATHFYEQGKADAIKDRVAQSKGINMDPRSQRTEDDIRPSGNKVRAVESNDSSKLRFKNHRNR